MAPQEDVFESIFGCEICNDYCHEPITVACCGKSFCQRCLQKWIQASVHSSGVPRCAAGCGKKLVYQLPSSSVSLKAAMEHLVPEEVKRRAQDDLELSLEEPATCYGGFKAWQVVAAARDIAFGNMVGVRQGTPGIVVSNFSDGNHLTVKFDTREDSSELCVNVLPSALMHPLPGGFQLSQKVCASYDLLLEGGVVVQLGTPGMVVGPVDEHHMHVMFHERTDGVEGYLNVHYEMISAYRLLVGGFRLGQKIQASMHLVVGSDVVVPFGTPGVVMGEYSDTRLSIAFTLEGQCRNTHFNVLPMEVRAFCDTPCDMPPGQIVQARTDLVSMNSVVVKAGTRGVVIACMDEMRIIVSFDGGDGADAQTQCLTVTFNTIEKANDTTATPTESPDKLVDCLIETCKSCSAASDSSATDTTEALAESLDKDAEISIGIRRSLGTSSSSQEATDRTADIEDIADDLTEGIASGIVENNAD